MLAAFTQAVQRSLKRPAKKMLGLRSMSEAHTGGVTFIQRFDSALRLNAHVHSLFLVFAFGADVRYQTITGTDFGMFTIRPSIMMSG